MGDIAIRELCGHEIATALELVWEVFKEFEAPDYSREGVEEFYKSIHDPEYLKMLRIFGAFSEGKPVGVIATRSAGTHIALFFVSADYQRRGIGRQLFDTVLSQCGGDKMTVNSSPYAVPVYHKLGFCDTDSEQTVNGLRFTPMERTTATE